jgi:hypothetical protein
MTAGLVPAVFVCSTLRYNQPMRCLLLVFTVAIACSPSTGDEGEGESSTSEGEGEPAEGEGEGELVGEGEGELIGEGEGEERSAVVSSSPPGTFSEPVSITLSTSTPGLTIWVSTNDTAPVAGVASTETTLTLTTSTMVRAIAVDAAGETQARFAGLWLHLDPDMASFSTSLPVLVLWSTFATPEQKEDQYTSAAMMVVEPSQGSTRWPGPASVTTRAGIKIRGSSSAGYSKRPWRVETWSADEDDDDDVDLLGMPAESDWVLNAPADFDRALMRNSVAFAMSNAIGRYAPRTRFAEVFVTGQGRSVSRSDHVGLYEVTERIKRGPNRVNIAKLSATDVNVTGGYIFKEDRSGPGDELLFAGTGDGSLSFQQPFVIEDPNPDGLVPAQLDHLRRYLDDIGTALTSPAFTNPAGQHYDQLLDVSSFIDHHIINLFTKNPDGFRLSGYFHKDRDGLLQAGPVWDFDRTMGCSSDDRASDPTWWDPTNQTSDTTYYFDHGFYGGLFDDPAFRVAYWQRLAEVLAGPLSIASLHAVIDDNAIDLEDAAQRNFERYPEYSPRGTYNDEVELLKAWLADRHDWISGCLLLPEPLLCTGG